MPQLALRFSQELPTWIGLAEAGDAIVVAALRNPAVLRELPLSRRERLYELAYLRLFLSWETYLEESFRRLAGGYRFSTVLPTFALLAPGPYATLAAADRAILGGNDYVSWANPSKVINRSRRFATDGPHELVLTSSIAHLQAFTAIRNRIAHPGIYARREFDAATTLLVGRRYRGSSAGRFLRSWETSTAVPKRMLDVIASELTGLAGQISP